MSVEGLYLFSPLFLKGGVVEDGVDKDKWNEFSCINKMPIVILKVSLISINREQKTTETPKNQKEVWQGLLQHLR